MKWFLFYLSKLLLSFWFFLLHSFYDMLVFISFIPRVGGSQLPRGMHCCSKFRFGFPDYHVPIIYCSFEELDWVWHPLHITYYSSVQNILQVLNHYVSDSHTLHIRRSLDILRDRMWNSRIRLKATRRAPNVWQIQKYKLKNIFSKGRASS